MLRLIKMWLTVPVMQRVEEGYWQGKGEEWRAEIVAYADDFVIPSRGYGGGGGCGRRK